MDLASRPKRTGKASARRGFLDAGQSEMGPQVGRGVHVWGAGDGCGVGSSPAGDCELPPHPVEAFGAANGLDEVARYPLVPECDVNKPDVGETPVVTDRAGPQNRVVAREVIRGASENCVSLAMDESDGASEKRVSRDTPVAGGAMSQCVFPPPATPIDGAYRTCRRRAGVSLPPASRHRRVFFVRFRRPGAARLPSAGSALSWYVSRLPAKRRRCVFRLTVDFARGRSFGRDTVCLSCSLSPFRFWRAWFAGCGAPSCFLWDVVFFIVVRHGGVGCPKGCPWGGDEVPLGIRLRRACVRLPEGASAGVRRCPQGCLWTGWGCSGDPMTHPDVPFYPCTTCRLQPRLVRAAADAMRDTPHGGRVAGSNQQTICETVLTRCETQAGHATALTDWNATPHKSSWASSGQYTLSGARAAASCLTSFHGFVKERAWNAIDSLASKQISTSAVQMLEHFLSFLFAGIQQLVPERAKRQEKNACELRYITTAETFVNFVRLHPRRPHGRRGGGS